MRRFAIKKVCVLFSVSTAKRIRYPIRIPGNSARIYALIPLCLISFVLGCRGSNEPSQSNVPLDSVYVTWGQPGTKYAVLDEQLPYQQFLPRFYAHMPSLPNISLIRAGDINEAIGEGTRFVGDEKLASKAQAFNKTLWLVVYLGRASSSPPQWQISSVTLAKNKITVTQVTKAPARIQTADVYPYIAFSPIDELPSGRYRLVLRDSDDSEPLLQRDVTITAGD